MYITQLVNQHVDFLSFAESQEKVYAEYPLYFYSENTLILTKSVYVALQIIYKRYEENNRKDNCKKEDLNINTRYFNDVELKNEINIEINNLGEDDEYIKISCKALDIQSIIPFNDNIHEFKVIDGINDFIEKYTNESKLKYRKE